MTATRPVPTPNLHCAPPCEKPSDQHDTPHRDGRFSTPHKERTAPRPQTTHRGQGSNATTRATCDVRGRSRAVCIGRGGVVTAQCRRSTAANWGRSSFRPSSARTDPFRVVITTATFPESRFFHACFFRVMLSARVAAGGLRCVRGRQAKGRGVRRGA